MGPFAVETLRGDTYALTYTDWYSRYSRTYLLKRKSEALTCLKHLLKVVFSAAQVTLRRYHTDNASELSGRETVDYLEQTVHATHGTSEPYTPQRNAIAERKFRTLGEMTAIMLHKSGFPRTMWAYAFEAATYIRNRIPSVRVDGLLKTPYELWTNRCHASVTGGAGDANLTFIYPKPDVQRTSVLNVMKDTWSDITIKTHICFFSP
jgi:transposase InsO family protein